MSTTLSTPNNEAKSYAPSKKRDSKEPYIPPIFLRLKEEAFKTFETQDPINPRSYPYNYPHENTPGNIGDVVLVSDQNLFDWKDGGFAAIYILENGEYRTACGVAARNLERLNKGSGELFSGSNGNIFTREQITMYTIGLNSDSREREMLTDLVQSNIGSNVPVKVISVDSSYPFPPDKTIGSVVDETIGSTADETTGSIVDETIKGVRKVYKFYKKQTLEQNHL